MQELLSNHALTLNSAYHIFKDQIETLAPMSSLDKSPELPSHRLLLSQLSASLNITWPTPAKKAWNNTLYKRQGDRSPITCPSPTK